MFTKEQLDELKQANKKVIISGVAAAVLACKLAQQEIIEIADDIVDYLKDVEEEREANRNKKR
jgi:hypothetical protein